MSAYHKKVPLTKAECEDGFIMVDPYLLDRIYPSSAAVFHAVKKLVMLGCRDGGKSYETDLKDVIWSCTRELELIKRESDIEAEVERNRDDDLVKVVHDFSGLTEVEMDKKISDSLVDRPKTYPAEATHYKVVDSGFYFYSYNRSSKDWSFYSGNGWIDQEGSIGRGLIKI